MALTRPTRYCLGFCWRLHATATAVPRTMMSIQRPLRPFSTSATEGSRFRKRLREGFVLGLSLLALPACSEGQFFGAARSEPVGPSRLRVMPSVFLGDVPCERGIEGGLQSYVADLFEPRAAGPDAGPVEPLATARAVACDRQVFFTVPQDQLYAVRIRGYELEASDPRLEDPDAVAPDWTAECGTGAAAGDAGLNPNAPTLSVSATEVVVRDCEPLRRTAETVLEVTVEDALNEADGGLVCGDQPGQISTFEATVAGETQVARCGEVLRFLDLRIGDHGVLLTAFAAGGVSDDAGGGGPAEVGDAGCKPLPPVAADAGFSSSDAGALVADAGQNCSTVSDAGIVPRGPSRWRTRCYGSVVAGQTRRAQCEPLTPL